MFARSTDCSVGKRRFRLCTRMLPLLLLHFMMACPFVWSAGPANRKPTAFLEDVNGRYDYQNVLVLGVGSDAAAAAKFAKKYHFDLVIPVSTGNKTADYALAAFEKLGIPTRRLGELEGKRIRNLYGYSYGSSAAVNSVAAGTVKADKLHLYGSPTNTVANGLNRALDQGWVKEVNFHRNEGDSVAMLGKLPGNVSGRFSGQVKEYVYTEKRNPSDVVVNKPIELPAAIPLGQAKTTYYNQPPSSKDETGQERSLHDLDRYFQRASLVMYRDLDKSPFADDIRRGEIPPFLKVPTYWTNADRPGAKTEAEVMSGFPKRGDRALVVGTGPEADILYKNAVTKLGPNNVVRIDSGSGETELQLEARKQGTNIILGVRENTSRASPSLNIGMSASVRTHSSPVDSETASASGRTRDGAGNRLEPSMGNPPGRERVSKTSGGWQANPAGVRVDPQPVCVGKIR